MQGPLGGPGQLGEREPGIGDHVGDVRAGAARDGVDAHPRLASPLRPRRDAGGPGAGEAGRHLEQLVETVDARDAELAEHRRGDRVGAGQVAGVALGHRRAGVGAADLHHDDGLVQRRRVLGREHERATVLEALDVAGDDPDLGLVGEVGGEVRELEVHLVPGRGPVREPDADLLALEHGPALVAGLGDERDRRPVEVGAELLERVEVGVRAEEADVATPDQAFEAALERGAVLAGLAEPGGEDHRELRRAGQDLLERVDRLAGEDDREVDLTGHVGEGRVHLVPEDRLVLRVDRVEGCAVRPRPGVELAGHRGVRLRRLLRRADERDRPRVQEGVEVHVAAGRADGRRRPGRRRCARARVDPISRESDEGSV